jgi:hypothetical protein
MCSVRPWTQLVALSGSRTVNNEPLPGLLLTVTSPPIMRASLRDSARAEAGSTVAPRCQRIRLGEVLEQLKPLFSVESGSWSVAGTIVGHQRAHMRTRTKTSVGYRSLRRRSIQCSADCPRPGGPLGRSRYAVVTNSASRLRA